MSDMKNVLVTGATGFIGYSVAKLLAEEGYRPRLLVRRMHRGMLVSHLDAEPVIGDLQKAESLERAVEGMDTVIHLGARATFEAMSLVRPSIVDGTANLFRASVKAGVEHFVHASSMLVHGSTTDKSQLIDADTAPAPDTDYGRAKLEAETWLQREAAKSDIGLAIIRLPHVYGAQDAFFAKIRSGFLLMPGLGDNLYCHMHVDDAARVMTETARQRLEIVSPLADDLPLDWNGFFGLVKTYYPHMRSVRVPRDLALWGASALQWWYRFQRKQTLETPDGVRGWNLQVPVKPGLVWNELGLKPEFPTAHEGVPSVLDDCVSYRWIHPVNDHR